MNSKTKKMTMIAMLCTISYVVMVLGRIPIVMFLKYDPKDIIITIGGFIFGPLTTLTISVVVSLVEMFTVSDTGIIGCIMNILASASFAFTAAFIYKKKHTLRGAVTGLIVGTIFMTLIMILWNYFLTPIYMGYPREAVVELLVPAILPFNLLKGGLNTAITLLVYKPIVTALRKAGLIETSKELHTRETKTGFLLAAFILLVSCIIFALILKGVI